MKIHSKVQGFTLIELMMVIAVAAILIMVAIPSFRTMIMNNRMTSTANEVIGAISFARMEAVKRGRQVRLGQLVTNSWEGGIVVWAGSGDLADGEEIRRWPAIHDDSTLVSTGGATLIFNALGRVDSGAVFKLCDSRPDETGREITLLSTGAVSTKPFATCNDG